MTACPACHRDWRDLPRHLAFAHQEVVVMHLDPPPSASIDVEVASWLYPLLVLAALALATH